LFEECSEVSIIPSKLSTSSISSGFVIFLPWTYTAFTVLGHCMARCRNRMLNLRMKLLKRFRLLVWIFSQSHFSTTSIVILFFIVVTRHILCIVLTFFVFTVFGEIEFVDSAHVIVETRPPLEESRVSMCSFSSVSNFIKSFEV
jgi:hypothetical protein